MVPAKICWPIPLGTSRASPVKEDSSNLVLPEMIVPSLGGDDPTGRRTLSPASSMSTGTDCGLLLSSSKSASVGRSFPNSVTAFAVLCRLNASRYRPEITKNVKKTTESKYVVVKAVEEGGVVASNARRATDEKYAIDVPSDIYLGSESEVGGFVTKRFIDPNLKNRW
jgi:hypothetical protein